MDISNSSTSEKLCKWVIRPQYGMSDHFHLGKERGTHHRVNRVLLLNDGVVISSRFTTFFCADILVLKNSRSKTICKAPLVLRVFHIFDLFVCVEGRNPKKFRPA